MFIGEVIVICLDTEEMMVDGVEGGGKNLGGTYLTLEVLATGGFA